MSNRLGIAGLLHVTGESDSGKTSFALECGAAPEKIAFIDSDVKGAATVKQLLEQGVKLGMYHNMVSETKGKMESQIHDIYMKIFDDIKPGQFDAIIVDTWSEFEKTLKPYVTKNPKKFRENWSAMGTIRGAEEWAASFGYEEEVIDNLLSKTELLILTSHLKAFYVGNKKVEGKYIPDCKAPMITKSFFRIWLRRNPDSPVPIGLILKRLNRKTFKEGKIRTINVLPLRVVPRPEDESLWDAIERYWTNPIGNAAPTTEQRVNEYEMSILDGTLTQDQKVALRVAMLDSEDDFVSSEPAITNVNGDGIINDVKEYIVNHPDATNEELLASVPGATLPSVIKARKSG